MNDDRNTFQRLSLIMPTHKYREQWADLVSEYDEFNESPMPNALNAHETDNISLIAEFFVDSEIPTETFWLLDDGRDLIIGSITIRKFLTDKLLFRGGNIGFGIRPTERNRGYAKHMLKLALSKARDIGLSRVLITCASDNVAGVQTILHNGGSLEDEILDGDIVVHRYWIDTVSN